MDIQNEAGQKRNVEGQFSQKFYMGRKELSGFLRKLADELEAGDEIKISTSEWQLPFRFREDIEVEIEKDGDELEIEIEFKQKRGPEGLSVG